MCCKSNFGDTESTFYTKLGEDMIENAMDEAHSPRRHTSNRGVVDGPPPCLDAIYEKVASGVGVYLTPTKKRRMKDGNPTNYM